MKEDYLFTDIVYYHTIIEKQQKHNIQKNFVLSIKNVNITFSVMFTKLDIRNSTKRINTKTGDI